MKNKLGLLAIILAISQAIVILLSWIITAAFPDLSMRSLLSGEGIRWFFAHFIENLSSKYLVWLLLGTIAFGTLKSSGLFTVIHLLFHKEFKMGTLHYRERIAIRTICIELLLFIVIILLLTILPKAVLISVTGDIFPSSFSQGFIAIIAFIVVVCGLTYGTLVGKFKTLNQGYQALASGFSTCAWIFPLYILICELIHSLAFVFLL